MKFGKLTLRWRWTSGGGGFWSGGFRYALNNDGTPYMCKANFGGTP